MITGPLTGVRIIDLTMAYAGPWSTMMLSDLGAEVIKVEPPNGEIGRVGKKTYDPGDFLTPINRNKLSFPLDITGEYGKKAFQDLVRKSDIVISNFRGGTCKRNGTDYETLKKINPAIIRVLMSGYGETGPLHDKPAYDIVTCGDSGLLSIQGEEGRTPTVPGGFPLADTTAGIMAAFHCLAALYKRSAGDGTGIEVRVSLLDGLMMLQTQMFHEYLQADELPQKQGSGWQMVQPYGVYATKEGYLTIGPAEGEKVIRLAGIEWVLEDERFSNVVTRRKCRREFDNILQEALMKKTAEEWVKLFLEENDVVCGLISNYEEALNNPQIQHRKYVREVKMGDRTYKTLGPTFDYPNEGISGDIEPPPDLGKHTVYCCKDILGYSDEMLDNILNENEITAEKFRTRMKQLS